MRIRFCQLSKRLLRLTDDFAFVRESFEGSKNLVRLVGTKEALAADITDEETSGRFLFETGDMISGEVEELKVALTEAIQHMEGHATFVLGEDAVA